MMMDERSCAFVHRYAHMLCLLPHYLVSSDKADHHRQLCCSGKPGVLFLGWSSFAHAVGLVGAKLISDQGCCVPSKAGLECPIIRVPHQLGCYHWLWVEWGCPSRLDSYRTEVLPLLLVAVVA